MTNHFKILFLFLIILSASSFAWYNDSYSYRQTCPYNATNFTTNETNFPVLCKIDTAALIAAGKANLTCSDILAVNSTDNGILNYEIESETCNSTTDVWASVNITANTTGFFYLYYGSPGTPTQQNPLALWRNASFVSVWHMGGNGTLIDSAGYNNLSLVADPCIYRNNVSSMGGEIDFITNCYFRNATGVGLPRGSNESTESFFMRTYSIKTGNSWDAIISYGTSGNYQVRNPALKYGAATTFQYATYSDAYSSTVQIPTTGADYGVSFSSNVKTTNVTLWNGTSSQGNLTYTPITGAGYIYLGATGWTSTTQKITNSTITEARISNVSRSFSWRKNEFSLIAIATGEESTGYVTVNQSLPANATYTTYDVPFAVNCSGSDTSYLVNITLDGIVNITNAAIANNTLYQANITVPAGYHNTTATCTNSSTNTSSAIFFTVAPIINTTLTLPVNTTYGGYAPVSVTCFGSLGAYLLNLTLDGAADLTGYALANGSTYIANLTLAQGSHNISATCYNQTTSNQSGTVTFFVQTAPVVTAYSPLNGTVNLSSSIPFGFSASSLDGTLNCSIFLNATINQTNASYTTGSTGQFTITGFQNGTYTWTVRCYDSLGSYGDSSTQAFIVAYDSGGGGTAEGQASEFVAAAIIMVGLLWFFAFLMHSAKEWLWKTVWMMACFLTAYMSIGIMAKGFSNLLAYTDMSDLSFAAMSVLMWCIILLFGWLLLSLAMFAFKTLMDLASGKKPEDGAGLGEAGGNG